jgi:hypothetical protein
MLERLRGLDHVEQMACRIAERTLGAVATANDVAPKQGAVDALLDYPDGRRGAFEVTQLATDGGASLHLDSLLKQDGCRLPLPGKWWWTVKIGDRRDLPRLRNIYAKIIRRCESVGVTDPRYLPLAEVDADTRWLVEESSVQMEGYPNVPATDGHRVRRAMITQPFVWGGEDETFSLLDEALNTAFDTDLIQRHVAKLRRTQADERHLFLVVDLYDLPFSLFGALGFADRLPAGAPGLPAGLTHLWLAPVYGHRVLIGTPGRWAETRDIRPSLGGTEASPTSPPDRQ